MNGPLDLGTNPQEVDTQAPVLVDGEYRFVIAKADVVEAPPEKDQTHNLRVQFATTGEERTTQGGTVQAGYPVSRTYPLTKSWERDIAKLVDAALQCEASERPSSWVECFNQLPGRELFVRVTVRDSDQYGLQNDIRGYRSLNG